ncbi:YdaS family helix-turn-helix protein [uncultured Sphingomonas sp.]|uniref:transcriptional regulator n=1 Tax=uncultured Sphingomonas sp. TaxID=158754 RepID=UPI0025861797|nr:YdaS family helix-turn-helix protein [uncultured Sphingomonas sp.]
MAIEHDLDSVLAKAVRNAGSQSEFGRIVGRRQSTIREWLLAGRVSHTAVLDVEAATGISRHDLRPDLYPREVAPALTGIAGSEIAR